MKRILFTATLMLATILPTAAHEIYAGFGFSPIVSMPDILISTRTEKEYYTGTNERFSGVFNIGYLYNITDRLAVGASFSHFSAKRDLVIGSSIALAELKNKCNVIMVNTKYQWLSLSKFSFYSRAGIGFNMVNAGNLSNEHEYFQASESDFESNIGFAWQVIPLGVDWNIIKPLSIFAEGGVGYSGCCIVGVKAKF